MQNNIFNYNPSWLRASLLSFFLSIISWTTVCGFVMICLLMLNNETKLTCCQDNNFVPFLPTSYFHTWIGHILLLCCFVFFLPNGLALLIKRYIWKLKFQKELWNLPEVLLCSLAEAMAVVLKRETMVVLDRSMPILDRSIPSLDPLLLALLVVHWGVEGDEKGHLEYYQRKMKYGCDQSQSRAMIKAHSMPVRAGNINRTAWLSVGFLGLS